MRKTVRNSFLRRLVMRRYYLHTRNGVYYAELTTPEGRKLAARSAGKGSEDEALLVVADWLKNGVPTGRDRKPRPADAVLGLDGILRAIRKVELSADDALRIVEALKGQGLINASADKADGVPAVFIEFLEYFWDYDASPYVLERLEHSRRIGRRHCSESLRRIRQHYAPAFEERPLADVTRKDLKKFSLSLKAKGYAAASVNRIIICASTALRWAFGEGIIPSNPAAKFAWFSGDEKDRGVLSPEEAEEVFNVPWKDKRSWASNLLSLTTGLRSGEILAVRKSDIGDKTLSALHSWSAFLGLKSPKNGKERAVPLLPEARAALTELLAENPHQGGNPFVFYGLLPDKPMDQKFLIDGLREAMEAVNARRKEADPEAELIDWKGRNICFHSWRHYFCSRMSDEMEAEKIARVSGHLSKSVFRKYADHIEARNVEEVGDTAARVFGNILQFHKRGA
jgi:integrase